MLPGEKQLCCVRCELAQTTTAGLRHGGAATAWTAMENRHHPKRVTQWVLRVTPGEGGGSNYQSCPDSPLRKAAPLLGFAGSRRMVRKPRIVSWDILSRPIRQAQGRLFGTNSVPARFARRLLSPYWDASRRKYASADNALRALRLSAKESPGAKALISGDPQRPD